MTGPFVLSFQRYVPMGRATRATVNIFKGMTLPPFMSQISHDPLCGSQYLKVQKVRKVQKNSYACTLPGQMSDGSRASSARILRSHGALQPLLFRFHQPI